MAEVIQPKGNFFYPWGSWPAEMAIRTLILAGQKGFTSPSKFGGLDIVTEDKPLMRINQTPDGVEGWYGSQISQELQNLTTRAVYGEV